MSKKQKNFKEWHDDEWGASDDVKRDGKRYNAKKEFVKQERDRKTRIKDSYFEIDKSS
jgi:hypothetical protein